MDEELKQLAALALRNAFWRDFSALVNAYVKAGEGLDLGQLEEQLGELTSVYGRDFKAQGDLAPSIWTQNGPGRFMTTGHDTILEALAFDRALEVHVCGKQVFERQNGEWYYVG